MIWLALWCLYFVLVIRRQGSCWQESIPLGLALSQMTLVLSQNFLLRLHLDAYLMLLLPVLMVLIWLLPARPRSTPSLPTDGRVLVLSSLCLVAAWWGQALIHDDDYMAHGAIQGQFFHGIFPPRNPWYPELELHGHHARSLLVALWSQWTGWSLPTAQFLLTNLLQFLLPWLAYWALANWYGRSQPAFWGSAFMTLGVSLAGRVGFLDTFQNNNSLAHLYLLLALYYFLALWRSTRWLHAGLLGLVLGGYAFVYETHFGVACLACCLGLLASLFWHPRVRLLLPRCGLVLSLALSLALTQGGPLSDWWQRASGSSPASLQPTQEQRVELHFPKSRLGQVLSTHGSEATVRQVNPQAWIYQSQKLPDPEEGYRPLWDRSVAGIHGLPLWLSPLLLMAAVRARDACGLWLVSFGMCSFLIPGLVDFGAFESEWFRWQYAAALCLAGALGIWLSGLLERKLFKIDVQGLLCTALLIFSWQHALFFAQRLLGLVEQRWSQGQPIYLGGQHYLTSQPQFFLEQDDLMACQWLQKQAQPGQKILINLPEEAWPNIHFGATLCSLTGLFPVGHRRLFADDLVGQWPYRLRADIRAFWQSGDLRLLERTPVDWLYLRDQPEFYPFPADLAGMGVEWTPLGSRRLGRVQAPWRSWPWQTRAQPMQVRAGLETPGSWQGSSCRQVQLTLENLGDQPLLPSQGRLLLEIGDDPDDWLLLPLQRRLEAKGSSHQIIPLAVPHRDGLYPCRFAWVDSLGAHPLQGEHEIRVDFLECLARMQLVEQEVFPAQPRAGQWVRLRSRWSCPEWRDQEELPVRVGLGALVQVSPTAPLQTLVSGTQAGETAYPPQLNQQPGQFRRTGARQVLWEIECWTLTPEAPGDYCMDWFFSPQPGSSVRRRGQSLHLQAPR